MSVIEKAIAWALGIADNPAHGYDQTRRWGPDYDCSSLVISAFKAAGLPLTATYTGNMKYDFLRNGFADASTLNVVELNMGAGLKRGDVLLNEQKHTAIYLGDGRVVQASSNESGGITGGKSGDQTGGEIGLSWYRNYPWDIVLRYVGPEEEDEEAAGGANPYEEWEDDITPTISPDMTSGAVLSMQLLLQHKWGKRLPEYGPDGEYGDETYAALTSFQRDHGLDADGICGPMTWAALIN